MRPWRPESRCPRFPPPAAWNPQSFQNSTILRLEAEPGLFNPQQSLNSQGKGTTGKETKSGFRSMAVGLSATVVSVDRLAPEPHLYNSLQLFSVKV